MRIGDAAAAAGTTPRALRFYEQRGLLDPPSRTGTGQRVYSDADVDRVRVVRALLGLGLTVEDVRARAEVLHLVDAESLHGGTVPEGVCSGTSPVVARRLDALDEEIGRLTRLRASLASATRTGRADADPADVAPADTHRTDADADPADPGRTDDGPAGPGGG
ncbi:MerR family transcriptional regulator [Streptomyces sp. NPDC058052]|uniref:MerR family transcriptional regulator n=1 Tax=Streptomyces sp. NPDC058052 TaxID=3346316 RepID=UPI0036E0287E